MDDCRIEELLLEAKREAALEHAIEAALESGDELRTLELLCKLVNAEHIYERWMERRQQLEVTHNKAQELACA